MKFILPVESIVQNKGGIILYDPDSNEILKQYVHNKDWRRNGWRGGKLHGDYLIATDWNDLHYFNVKEWKYEKTFKKNTFNDLHYVEIFNDKLYIVNTGLDAIEIFDSPMNPKFKEIIFLYDKNPKLFKRRSIDLNIKYNKKMKVKPHSAHPNCISSNGKDIVVTCFEKEQSKNSGEIINLHSGEKCVKGNFDCHDGIFYKGNFYTTWTRHAKILVFDSINNSPPIKKIKIGPRNWWWRGMIIENDIAYVFRSDGYKGRKTQASIAIVNLNTGKSVIKKLPFIDDIHWDTVYQPNILED